MAKTPTRKLTGGSLSGNKSPPRAKKVVHKGISLPTRKTTLAKNLEDYTIFLYGRKGVGKTSLIAQFPDTTIFQWEPRRRSVPCLQIPKDGEPQLTWPRWLEYEELLAAKPCRVAIDNVGAMWRACFTQKMIEFGIKRVNQLPGPERMSFWSEAKADFADSLANLADYGCRFIFTSHFKKVIVNPRDAHSFGEWEPDCGATWGMMQEICDIVIFYGYYHGERTMIVRGTNLVYTSPGPEGHFLDPDGEQYKEFAVSSRSAKEAYKDLKSAFSNKVYGFAVDEDEDDEAEEEEREDGNEEE